MSKLLGLMKTAPSMALQAAKAARPGLEKTWGFMRVEMRPPSPSDLSLATQQFNQVIATAKSGRWKEITVREGWTNTLVAVEIAMWFFVGECIGKRSLIGYHV